MRRACNVHMLDTDAHMYACGMPGPVLPRNAV